MANDEENDTEIALSRLSDILDEVQSDNKPQFAQICTGLKQTLAASPGASMPGQAVLFENIIVASTHIDVSLAASTGQVKINKAGWYDVNAALSLDAPANIAMALFKNGVYIPNSTFANLCVHFDVGDMLTMCNASSSPVVIVLPPSVNASPATSAFLKIFMLREDEVFKIKEKH